MRALIQVVRNASVQTTSIQTNKQTISRISQGLLILLGIHQQDTPEKAHSLAQKLARLRCLGPEHNQSLLETQQDALVVSQFTLYAENKKGTRLSFSKAAPADQAQPLYTTFIHDLQTALGKEVATGSFGQTMQVQLHNEGPYTFILEN